MPKKGFAILPLIIVVALIIGSGAFWYFGSQGLLKVEKKPCTLAKHNRQFQSKPYYEGSLIDSHIHLPTTAKMVSSIAQKEDVEKAKKLGAIDYFVKSDVTLVEMVNKVKQYLG